MTSLEFARTHIWLGRKPISFSDRDYLVAIYEAIDAGRNTALRCSRQVEKSTLLANQIICRAVRRPGTRMLLVCPREEQARIFTSTRLMPVIENSPLIRRTLIGEGRRHLNGKHCIFANESTLHMRAAYHSADSAHGISADVLLIDEFQDIAAGTLPILKETQSHSPQTQVIITGTPKHIDNHLEGVFAQSTANEWQVRCRACQKAAILDERVLGATCLTCPACEQELFVKEGQSVPRNPQSTWGDGFSINHLMVPWLSYNDVLARQASYDAALFRNECLGLSTTLGDHIITRQEIEACCVDYPMANSVSGIPERYRTRIVAGLDWGGGSRSATVIVIGYMLDELQMRIVRLERINAREDPELVVEQVVRLCRAFRVPFIAADGGGNGFVYNRVLLGALAPRPPRPGLCAIKYSTSDQKPVREGALVNWTVNRNATIGTLFTRIKKRLFQFPRVTECGSFLDEFTCELAVYNDKLRTVDYTHPDTQPDDSLHATNYAQLLGLNLVKLAPLLSDIY